MFGIEPMFLFSVRMALPSALTFEQRVICLLERNNGIISPLWNFKSETGGLISLFRPPSAHFSEIRPYFRSWTEKIAKNPVIIAFAVIQISLTLQERLFLRELLAHLEEFGNNLLLVH